MLPSRIRDLNERRVPQIVAIYLGASWGAVEFMNFLEQRYMISPHWTELTLLTLGLFLPSVIMFAYFHGRPGPDAWHRLEKVGIPANAVVAVVLLSFFLSGKSLGAMTTTITLQDENDETIQRVVPKSEFRKRVALFYFDGEPSDTASAWLRYGVPLALEADLGQDIFVDIRCPCFSMDRLRHAGYEAGLDVPLSLMRRMADEQHLPHIVSGSVARQGDSFEITVRLYETRRGRLSAQRTHTGPDLFALIDDASIQLRRDLGVPARQLETVDDLPVAEVLTSSLPAFRRLSEATVATVVAQDWGAALPLLEEAVSLDPTFALAQYHLATAYLFSGRQAEAQQAMQVAVTHLYRLPERMRYAILSDHHYMRQEVDRALAAIDMWTALYPEDIRAYQMLAMYRSMRDDKAGAISALLTVLEIDPGQHELLQTLGALYQARGDLDSARNHYQRYADQFPENHRAFMPLGRLSWLLGDHDEARRHYDRVTLLDPQNIGAMVTRAELEAAVGEKERARRQLDEALEAARTPADRIVALGGLQSFHERKGQYRRAVELNEQALAEKAAIQPMLFVHFERLSSLRTYVEAGETERAMQIFSTVAVQIPAPYDAFVPVTALLLYVALEDAAAAAAALPAAEEGIRLLQFEALRPVLLHAQGRIHELRGEYAAAVASYRAQLSLDPTDAGVRRHIGRALRLMGSLAEAEQEIVLSLREAPASPQGNYELALVYFDMGQRSRGLPHLRRAVDVWRDADPTYAPAARAKAKLAELERNVVVGN